MRGHDPNVHEGPIPLTPSLSPAGRGRRARLARSESDRGFAALTGAGAIRINPANSEENPMKVRNSLKSLRSRHRNNRLVRRKGRVYVINKTQRRYKARQG